MRTWPLSGARVDAASSLRARSLLAEVLTHDGWHGVMAFTLPEALWLVQTGVSRDVLVACPTPGRPPLRGGATRVAAHGRSPCELCEQVDELQIIDGYVLTGTAATYRWEGEAFR